MQAGPVAGLGAVCFVGKKNPNGNDSAAIDFCFCDDGWLTEKQDQPTKEVLD